MRYCCVFVCRCACVPMCVRLNVFVAFSMLHCRQRRKEKKEQEKREKDMREAAFDGEIDTLRRLFDKFEVRQT